MRIVAGRLRGLALVAPEGRDTRPTTDRNRESMVSMIMAARGLDVSDEVVLDAFAGSGALGFELLSRGAAHITFIEKGRAALTALSSNMKNLKVERSEVRLIRGDAYHKALTTPLPAAPSPRSYSLVLLDPPYAHDPQIISKLIADMVGTHLLSDNALIVYERDAQRPGLTLEGFECEQTKRYGTTAVDLWRAVATSPKEARGE